MRVGASRSSEVNPPDRTGDPSGEAGPWSVIRDPEDPVVAVALHAGHDVRAEVDELLTVAEVDRFREEDPHTDRWTTIAGNRVIVHRSRFEVDLNRPRDRAVYATPEHSWGLQVWSDQPDDVIARSLETYDAFYAMLEALLDDVVDRHGAAAVVAVHSYNHRRDGPDGPIADARANPGANVGTRGLDRERFGELMGRYLRVLNDGEDGIDARENVRFTGGHLAEWVNAIYDRPALCAAVDVKKTFMDEWTGELDAARFAAIGRALDRGAEILRRDLRRP